MQKATVIEGAASRYAKSLNLPAHAGYTTEEFRYKAVLKSLEGKEVILIPVKGGVQGCVYPLLPENTVDHHNKPIQSKVVAISSEYVENIQDTDPVPIPYFDHQGSKAIRLLTCWVDGFMGFV